MDPEVVYWPDGRIEGHITDAGTRVCFPIIEEVAIEAARNGMPVRVVGNGLLALQLGTSLTTAPRAAQRVESGTLPPPHKRLVFGVDPPPQLPFLTSGGKVRKRR